MTGNYLINYYGNIPTHAHREKVKRDTSEDTSGGKSIEIPDGVAKVM